MEVYGKTVTGLGPYVLCMTSVFSLSRLLHVFNSTVDLIFHGSTQYEN